MATSTLQKKLEQNLNVCSLCLNQFKEPEELPCLHRHWKDCLKTVILESQNEKVICPICKQQCVIPGNGVDEYKTNFHKENILEFIQLQQLLENTDQKECVSCLRKINVSVYCFKYQDFLCHHCYNIHVTSKMFLDHRKRTLKLDNNERGSLTLEKLATLSENPRCRLHEEEYAKLCCTTCRNEPVCIICTYSKHKGHALRDVSDIAKTDRDLLKQKIDELSKCKSKLYELPKKIDSSKQQLNINVLRKTEGLIEQYKQQSNKIKLRLDDQKDTRERGLADIEKRRKVKNGEITMKFEDELQKVKQKFDNMWKEAKVKFDKERQEFDKKCDKIEERLSSMQKELDDNLQSLTTATNILTVRNEQKLRKISDYCDGIIEKYENFSSTTSSILASEVAWTDVRCIPDLIAICEVLKQDMKREYPDVESLSVVDVNDITEVIFDYITITEHEENVVEGILLKDWCINGIAIASDGSIIITGRALKGYSHITVINKAGEIKRQDHIKSEKIHDFDPFRCCSCLKGLKIATVCQPDEIGIYDISDGSYKKKFISEVITGWPEDGTVVCVSTDPVNNHIIVGTNSIYVYVFNDHMNYIHTINLPGEVIQPYDVTVHESSLCVCDYHSNTAYAVTNMAGLQSKVLFEFTQPNRGVGEWSPSSVCTDHNKFIYILWLGNDRSTLTQYSQDGRHVLREREVNPACDYFASTADTLLIISPDKIYMYGLIVT